MITPKQHYRRTTKILRTSLDSVLTVPPLVKVWEWAESRRFMPKAVTAKPGYYSLDATPYAKEPQEAYFDPEVQTTVLCWASRTGKTETEMNLMGYTIDYDPTHMLWVYPTIDSGKKWRKEFANPMFRSSKCFKGKIREGRGRDADNTMLSIGFPGGRIGVIGANSPSGFRQIQAPRVICDEIDAMENSIEGDPVALAFKRADNYQESIKVVSSTPTIMGRSRIWDWLERSDFRKWHCPCPKCNHEQVWMWAHMKWNPEDTSDAWLLCEKCGHHLGESERQASVRAGRWIATKPFNGIRGYWLNGLNSLFTPTRGFKTKLHQFAVEFLNAKDSPSEKKTWENTFLSEPSEEGADKLDHAGLVERCEEYTPQTLPVSVLVVVAGGDVQANRIEIEFIGYGSGEECWHIEKVIIDGDPDKDEVWDELDKRLLQVFKREDGVELRVERAFIDFRYKNRRVLAFCAPRIGRGVYPCGGLNRAGITVPPLLPSQPSRNNRAKIPHWMVGVTVAKQFIYDSLLLPIPGARSAHFPVGYGYDAAHFRQLCSERRKIKYSYGQAYTLFEPEKKGTRNEALDMNVYALAAMTSLGRIAWSKLAENLKASIKETQAPAPEAERVVSTADPAPPKPKPQQAPRAIRPSSRGSWATRY